jgi:5-formyltetrahydrofolate cyclo-ligase
MRHDKSALRREAREARRALPPDARRRAAEAVARADLSPLAPLAGRVVAGYVAKPDELDAEPLLRRLAREGVPLALPRTPVAGLPLTFHAWMPGDPLVPGPFGLREPAPEAPVVVPALLFVPCLAFSPEGFRLGYGGGYYDRTLAELRAGARRAEPPAIGLAFAAQERAFEPEAYDQKLDYVLTELGLRAFPGEQARRSPGP